MFYRWKRHPIAVQAHFRHVLVLTYAYPAEVLEPLVPPGLQLDTHNGLSFLAVAMVQTCRLRPWFLPRWLGRDFFLAGYRVFVRHQDRFGRVRRGLHILRSDTDRCAMVCFGNLLTHYNYRKVKSWIQATEHMLEVRVQSPDGLGDLQVTAKLGDDEAGLPDNSPFQDFREARRFAGPLPYTFDYEPETHSIIRIRGVRQNWRPRPVEVRVWRNTFLEQAPFNQTKTRLAAAFHLADIDYRWERGVRECLDHADLERVHGASSSPLTRPAPTRRGRGLGKGVSPAPATSVVNAI